MDGKGGAGGTGPCAALTMEPARHTSKVTALRCCLSRLMAGWAISRYWLSKTMKMGFLESSSNLHSPSLRDRRVAGGRGTRALPGAGRSRSYLKLLLHQSCSRYATESTTMRRRHRLTFMIRSAEGSAGRGISGPRVPVLPLCPPGVGPAPT